MSKQITHETMMPALKPISLRRYRVEFYEPNNDERTAADVPDKLTGGITLTISADQDPVAIAFKRCPTSYLKCTKTAVFNL